MKTQSELLTLMTMLAQNALCATDHAERMKLAQELGALKWQIEQLEGSKFAPLEAAFIAQQAQDDDGWIENTGVMPECEVAHIRTPDGEEMEVLTKRGLRWTILGLGGDITHYKPA